MIQTNTQQSQAAVRDPVCGMEIEPAQAFATRMNGEETVYFCSERCVKQFDREHTGSATTGVSDTGTLRQIELSVADLYGRHSASRLEEQFRDVPGIWGVTANAKAKLLRIVYHPSQVQVETMVERARAAGYTLGTATTQLTLEGMHCASCVVTIEEALKQTPGVLEATVNVATNAAHVVYMPGLIDRRKVVQAIEEAGYQVREAPSASAETSVDRAEQERAHEYQTLLRKFWFAAVISLPVIVFSYPQFFPGLRDWLTPGSDARRIVWALLGLVTIPVMVWAGSHFFTGMWQALKHRQATMYTLIAIGVSAAWLYSGVAVVAPQVFPKMELAEAFYDVTAVVVALVNLGLALELRARGHTTVLAEIGFDEDEILRVAATIERNSEHPLAGAIVDGAKAQGMTLADATNFNALPGHGVEADVEGQHILLGNARLMSTRNIALGRLERESQRLADDGKTPMYIAINGRAAGIVAAADTVKDESAAAIAALKRLGLQVVMLTGDTRRTAEAIGRQVGVDRVLAEVLPQDKSHEVQKLQLEGKKVGMVGDGINDAPALTQADVGFAIGTGTDVAIEAADITLMSGSLKGVVIAIEISKATMRNVRQNLLGAFIYNGLGIPVAMGLLYPFIGLLLSPLLAAAAMAASSVTVVTNANRLRGWQPKEALLIQEPQASKEARS